VQPGHVKGTNSVIFTISASFQSGIRKHQQNDTQKQILAGLREKASNSRFLPSTRIDARLPSFRGAKQLCMGHFLSKFNEYYIFIMGAAA
jgi:hypothetical protein